MIQNLFRKANKEKLSDFLLDYVFIEDIIVHRFGTYTLTCNSTFILKKIMIQYVGCYKSQLLPKDEG